MSLSHYSIPTSWRGLDTLYGYVELCGFPTLANDMMKIQLHTTKLFTILKEGKAYDDSLITYSSVAIASGIMTVPVEVESKDGDEVQSHISRHVPIQYRKRIQLNLYLFKLYFMWDTKMVDFRGMTQEGRENYINKHTQNE